MDLSRDQGEHGAEYISRQAVAQEAAAHQSAAVTAQFPSFNPPSEAEAPLSTAATSAPSSTDSTTRLIDLATKRRQSWLWEKEAWGRIEELYAVRHRFPEQAEEQIPDALRLWDLARQVLRALDELIAAECAHSDLAVSLAHDETASLDFASRQNWDLVSR